MKKSFPHSPLFSALFVYPTQVIHSTFTSLNRWMVPVGMASVFLGAIPACSVSAGKKAKPAVQTPPAASPTGSKNASEALVPRLGKVEYVDKKEGFILVDIGTAPAPAPGVTLRAYAENGKFSELVVSSLQKRPHLIADIRSGNPLLGDSVVIYSSTPGVTDKAPGKTEPSKGAASVEVKTPQKESPQEDRLIVPSKKDSTQYLMPVPVSVLEGGTSGAAGTSKKKP